MSVIPSRVIDYPESDGKPMAENTKQLEWIFLFVGNLRVLFADDANVFVAGNQNWYPVEGEPGIVQAPDAYVVFGRPKGHRGSYQQWKEGDIPMTIAGEVLSPGNTKQEMIDKQEFYREHGVEEYYVYDPDSNHLEVYIRRGSEFRRERRTDGFVSPRLKIRFDFSGPEMVVRFPDGSPFLSMEELKLLEIKQRRRADAAERRAEQEAHRAEQEAHRAEQEHHARLAAEAQTQAEQQARLAAEAQTQAEQQARLAAEAQTQAEQQARLAAEAQTQMAELSRLAAETQARTQQEARLAAEAQARMEELARLAAETQAKSQQQARNAAEVRIQALEQAEERSQRLAATMMRIVALTRKIADGTATPDDHAEWLRLQEEIAVG